jgi:CRISPR-associated protein Cst1
LLNADDQCNFGADGQPGLPVSGLALTTIQAMSLAAPIVSGKAMIVATDDRRLLLSLVQEWQALIRSRVQLSEASGEKCKGWGGPRSRLIEQIIRLESVRDKQQGLDLNYSGSATIYHASNSGQGPDLTVYTLELPALSFVRKAQGIKYRESWQRLVASSWREVDNKDKDPVYARSNDVYEAVFDLPIGSRRFIRRFFLGPVVAQLKSAKPAEPKKGKKVKAEAIGPISPPTSSPIALWDLLELFVKEVVGMERTRIEAIRTLADRLAGVVRAENDRRLFQRIYTARKSFEVRQLLIQLGMRRLKDGLEPAIRFEEYLEIFEEGDELARADFGLAWDLTRMRVIEMLFENKWFDGNKEVLEDIKVEEEEI